MIKRKGMYHSMIICILVTVHGITTSYGQESRLSLGEQPVFKASKAKNMITIDGKMNESDWESTEVRSFNYFYRIEKSTDKQRTKYRMLWDEENLYLFFECEDEFITSREKTRDGKPYLDDCAEIMLIPVADSLDIHFCFELNLYKAANDLIFLNNFYKGKDAVVKAYNPEYEVEVDIRGTLNDNSDIDEGWSMELAIPLRAFNNLDTFFKVQKGTQWAFIAVRQDRNDAKGDRRSTSTLFPIYDIEKSIHQPNRFGLLEFVD